MTEKSYNKINELLAEYSKVEAELEKTEGEIKQRQLKSAETMLPDHATLKVRLDQIETELKKLTDENYAALFPGEDKRSHKTPFGELAYHKSTSIEFDDREKVLLKIKLECRRELDQAKLEQRSPRFQEATFIRSFEEPNLDALAGMDDAMLALFGFHRVQKDNFKVKPFSMKSDKPKADKKAKVQS